MSKLKNLPIKVFLPLVIMFMFLLMFVSIMTYQYFAQISDLENTSTAMLKQHLSVLQGELEEEFSEYNNSLHGERAVSAFGLMQETRSLAVIDENNQILLATKYSWKKQLADKTIPNLDLKMIEKIKSRQLPLAEIAKDGMSIQAYYPILLPAKPGQLRSNSVGIIFLDYDLGIARSAILKSKLTEGTFLGIVGLFFLTLLAFLLNKLVGQPIQHLYERTHHLADGELGIQVSEYGQGELGLLGSMFNKMSSQIEENVTKIRRSERDLSTTLDSIGDAVIVTNALGIITRANLVASKLTGWAGEEAIGQPLEKVFKIINSATRESAENPVTKTLDTGRVVGLANHTALIAKDGSEFQIADSAAPIVGKTGKINGVVLVFRDVTAEYKLQTALRESESKFRNLVEASSDWIWEVDSSGRYTYASPRCFEILGYKPEELIGKTPFDLMPTDEDKRIGNKCTVDVAKKLVLPSLENSNLHKEGYPVILETHSVPFFNNSGGLLGYRGVDRDITERKKTEAILAESENRFRQLFEKVPNVAVQGYDRDRKLIFWNIASEKLYGYSKKEALGAKIEKLIVSTESSTKLVQSIDQWLENDVTIPASEVEMRHKDGSKVLVFSSHILLKNTLGEPEIYRIDIDLSERQKAQAEVEQLAYFDILTNLPNRRLFLDRLQSEISVAEQHSISAAILYMDLDNFKTINDSLGHSVGDELLKEIGQRIKAQIRGKDTVSRFGGDEFVVLLKELNKNPESAKEQARLVAEKIQLALSHPMKIDRHELFITSSIGISLFSAENHLVADLIKQADTAMYRAKEDGRNSIRFFEAIMQADASMQLLLERGLRLALLRGEFFLLYQPQVNLSGKIIGVEALLRWNHPSRGIILPDEFIAAAEDTRIILQIGEWVLLTACQQLKVWEPYYQSIEFHMAINISPYQFRLANFVSQVEEVVKHTKIDPHRLDLEVTEGIVIENIKDTVKKMHTLKKMGILFSIDDFGTGYSSLSYLKRLPLDQLKIDQSFVRDISQDPNDETIIETIITMAHILGMEVIAEGVETDEQVKFLHGKGCNIFQGYYFDKPLSPEAVTNRLEAVQKTLKRLIK